MKQIERYAPLVGRILLSLIFLKSGYGKIGGWEKTAGYMGSHGMPLVPLFLFGAIVFELAGALSLLLGFKAKFGAALLIIFLIPTTIIFHNFWAFEGAEMGKQMSSFIHNLAILGGLFIVLGLGSGPLSLDGIWKKRE